MLVFFLNVSHRISSQIFCFILSFLSNRWLQVLLDGKSSQEYPVNAGVPEGFIPSTLMTFLMMLSVIMLSILVILLSILRVIRHLICGNNKNWLLNLNLIYGTLWFGVGSGFLISMLEKLK